MSRDVLYHLSSMYTHSLRLCIRHFRKRLFKCETCHTTYRDPARLAKCRERYRDHWFRCPELRCIYQ